MNPARLLTNTPPRIAFVARGVCRNVAQRPAAAPEAAFWADARLPATLTLIGTPVRPVCRGEQYRQLYQAAQQVAALPSQFLRLDREPEIGIPSDQASQPDLDFLLGQVRSDAVVAGVPKGQGGGGGGGGGGPGGGH